MAIKRKKTVGQWFFIIVAIGIVLIALFLPIMGIYVGAHFISKFW